MPEDTLTVLRRYPWPGNVRELQSVLKQALLNAAGPSLRPEFLPPAIRGDLPGPDAPIVDDDLAGLTSLIRDRLATGTTGLHAKVLERAERILILEVLTHVDFNQSRAARTLGISRTTLRARMAALGIGIDRVTTIEDADAEG